MTFVAAPRKTKQRSAKRLQTTSLSYSNAESTLKVTLTFNKVKKTKRENFNFVHLLSFFLSFSSGITGKLYCVCNYWTYQTIALVMKFILTCCELRVSYDWWVTAIKLFPETVRVLGSRLDVFRAWHIWSSHTQNIELVCYNRGYNRLRRAR